MRDLFLLSKVHRQLLLLFHDECVDLSPLQDGLGSPVASEVVVDAGLHVLQSVQDGEHVQELGQSQVVRLRDEVLPPLGPGQLSQLVTEPSDRRLYELEEVPELLHFRLEDGQGALVDVHSVRLVRLAHLNRKK